MGLNNLNVLIKMAVLFMSYKKLTKQSFIKTQSSRPLYNVVKFHLDWQSSHL